MDRNQQATTMSAPAVDPDGIAPGYDLELMGKRGAIKFSGHFFATPHIPNTVFARGVVIVFASKDIYVAQDMEHKNLYVVDRAKRL